MNPMKTDVAIIGGGFAGATAAAMLGRAGIETAIIEPHAEKRPEFRCEKLAKSQLALLASTGLASEVLPQTRINHEVWIVRYGRMIDRRPVAAVGFQYHELVNGILRLVPHSVRRFHTKATRIHFDGASTAIELGTGETITSRIAILASGLNPGIRGAAGMDESVLSKCHTMKSGSFATAA